MELSVDVTRLTPGEAAEIILEHINKFVKSVKPDRYESA
jgi:hypothetical protein